MKIYNDTNDFYEIKEMLWSGAEDTLQIIYDDDKFDVFNDYVEDIYPDGISLTSLNDMLRFDKDQVFNDLGIVDDEELANLNDLVLEINDEFNHIKATKEDIINKAVEDDYDTEENLKDLFNDLTKYMINLNNIDINSDTDFIELEEAAYNVYYFIEDLSNYSDVIKLLVSNAKELERKVQELE